MFLQFRIILIVFLAFASIPSEAQSWKWAKGSTASFGFAGMGNRSEVYYRDITSDKQGNIYMLALGGSQFQVNGSPLTGQSNQDIFISSYTCDGRYRWSKLIGSASDSESAYALRADSLGGVYVLADMRGRVDTRMIGTDTSMTPDTRTMYLIKLDTLGQYGWLRMPQPDTIGYRAAAVYSQLIDMAVDPQGTVHVLAMLAPGLYGGSYAVTAHGVHVLRYTSTGAFAGGVALPITLGGLNGLSLMRTMKLASADRESRYLVTGTGVSTGQASPGPISIGGASVPWLAGYAASFSSTTGALQWLKMGTNQQASLYARAAVDNQGGIYVTGSGDSSAANGSAVFNGVAVGNVFVMKMNASNGAPVWTSSGRSSYRGGDGARVSKGVSIAYTGGRLLVGGRFTDTLSIGSYRLTSSYAVDAEEGFTMELDATTGSVSSVQDLGGTEAISLIQPDRKGNFYVAGQCARLPMSFGSHTIPNPGALSMMYLAKWGYDNCNCVLPAPNFTAAAQPGNVGRFTYTGTTGGVDSLVWQWGDGSRQKVTSGFTTPLNHTYAATGRYNVCVTAYNDTCGENTFCRQTPLSVGALAGLAGVSVYPNPAAEQIFIEGAAGGRATVYSMLGQVLTESTVTTDRHALPTGVLPSGSYLLQLQLPDGRRGSMRFVRE